MKKLNLGSGWRLLEDYINIDFLDLHFQPNAPYIKMDVFDLPLYFGSDSVDEVYASHFFEHLTHTQVLDLMYKIWDVLKPGGKLIIITPDFLETIKLYRDKQLSDGDFNDVDLLHTKIFNIEEETLHKSVWYDAIGKYYLTRENFYRVDEVSRPSNEEIKFVATKLN
jgi:predicted SAM-dependent methyltransferase